MSLFHVCIYKFDLMLHNIMLPEAHKNRGLISTRQVLVHFCVKGNFSECKIGGTFQKVVSLLKIK